MTQKFPTPNLLDGRVEESLTGGFDHSRIARKQCQHACWKCDPRLYQQNCTCYWSKNQPHINKIKHVSQ